MEILAIPSMAGQIDALYALQMDGNSWPTDDFLHPDIRRARMVHWYACHHAILSLPANV
jgi:hypothetical protein